MTNCQVSLKPNKGPVIAQTSYDGHGQEKGRRSPGNPRSRDGQPSEPIAVRLRYRGRRAYRQVCAHLNEFLAVNEVSVKKAIAPTSSTIPIANIKDLEIFVFSMGTSMIPTAD
jgi:hypothetical protein